MSVEDPKTPEDRLRRIEQETDELAEHLDQAREAVRRAGKADSLASPDTEGMERGVVGGEAQEEEPGDEAAEPGRPQRPDRA